MPQDLVTNVPFPIRISPEVERATADHLSWPRAFGLLQSEPEALRHVRSQYADLAARCFPFAQGADLDLGVDQMSWFFIFDDQFDGTYGQDEEHVERLTEPLLRMLDAAPDRHGGGAQPLFAAFADLWARSAEGMSPAWRARAAESWRTYIAGHLTEARHRKHYKHPPFAAHFAVRKLTCGVYPIIDLAERLGRFEIPERAYRSEPVTQLRTIAAEVVVLENEIFSVEKEEAAGDQNMLLGLEEEIGCSREAAIDLFYSMIRQRAIRCVALEREIHGLGDTLGLDRGEIEAVRRYYTDAVQTVLRGTHDWQKLSGRYSVAPTVAERTYQGT